jgi:hypothetical protein
MLLLSKPVSAGEDVLPTSKNSTCKKINKNFKEKLGKNKNFWRNNKTFFKLI